MRDVPSGPLLRAGHDWYVDGPRAPRRHQQRSGGETRCFVQLIDFLSIRAPRAREGLSRAFSP
ncbi:MAG: hypothetical protein R3A48_17285 [Polyangiales bacterium]